MHAAAGDTLLAASDDAHLVDRSEVLEMRLKSTHLDPEKAAEYRFLQQVVGELQTNAPRSCLLYTSPSPRDRG